MASVADTSPNVYFHWVLWLRLVPWLLSPFIAAKSSVCLNLDTCFISVNDIFKPHPFVFPCLLEPFLCIHIPDHLAIAGTF